MIGEIVIFVQFKPAVEDPAEFRKPAPAAFIEDDTATVLNRALAGGAATLNQQLLCDFFFDETAARPMPTYSVPGLIDHF